MTIPEAAQLVIKATEIGDYYNILLFDMGKPIKIYDLAVKLVEKYAFIKTKIDICGLRPGEKLYEELLCSSENCIPTTNKNIMLSKHENIKLNENFLVYNKVKFKF